MDIFSKRVRLTSGSVIALCAAATGLFLLLPRGSRAQAFLYIGASVLALVAMGGRATRHRLGHSPSWRRLTIGLGLFAVANVIWFGGPVIGGLTLPFPSVADPLFLLGYAFVAAGLVSLNRSRTSGASQWGALVDTAIITVTASAVTWEFLLEPMVRNSATSLPARLVALAYPLFDLLLLALAVRVLFTPGPRPTPFWLVVGYVSLQLVGDIGFTVTSLRGTFYYGHPSSAAYVLSYGLLAAAFLHPKATTLTSGGFDRHVEMTQGRLWCVGVAALGTQALFLIRNEHSAVELVLFSSALFALALARMFILVRDLRRKAVALEGREQALRATIDRLNQSEDDLAHLAHHDPLTGLPNRLLFNHRLETCLSAGRDPVAVMVLDIDGFKTINDSLGHSAGDALLVNVARRLRGAVRSEDMVARFGGDEFTVLAADTDEVGACELASRLLRALEDPFTLDGRTVFCQVSIGLAVGGTVEAASGLVQDADAAMYTAKRKGGKRYEAFCPEMHAQALDRLALECDLRAVRLGVDLTLHYQPVVNLDTGELCGFEALLRWQHPERGMVSPADFIPIAEETGAIVPIGRWVIGEACRQLVVWRRDDPFSRPLHMNVNVSARQLDDDDIIDDVRHILVETGLDPWLLTLEITETMLVTDEAAVCERLRRLKELGVRISVDDFGTGYSSLGQLNRFPVDELKIDRSFVAGLGTSGVGSSVALAAIRLARSLHIDVVAEGVECEEQLAQLRLSSCTRGQGYYFWRPLPAATVDGLLREAPHGLPTPTNPLILVVDDDDAIRMSTARILQNAGFRTIEAATAGEALAAASATPPNAAVLDVSLPDGDGVALGVSLRSAMVGDLPVIHLSGTARSGEDRARGLELGADAYLIKPVIPRELVATVTAVLRARHGTADAWPAVPTGAGAEAA